MIRKEYLHQVIELYLQAPHTPSRARRVDWAIASTFFQQGIDLENLAHAIRLTALRRHYREPDLPSLEPVCSLAYFRSVLDFLHKEPHDSGYVDYIRWRYEQTFADKTKNAAHRQNTALSERR